MIEKFSLHLTPVSAYWDIVYLQFPPNQIVDLQKAKDMVNQRLKMTEDKQHFVIADISNVRFVTQEAKKFLQQKDSGLKNIIAASFIATNPISTMLANIFLKTPKDFEAKFFTKKAEAFDWINEIANALSCKVGSDSDHAN